MEKEMNGTYKSFLLAPRWLQLFVFLACLVGCGDSEEKRINAYKIVELISVSGTTASLSDTISLPAGVPYTYKVLEGPQSGQILGNSYNDLAYSSDEAFLGDDLLVLLVSDASGKRYQIDVRVKIVPELQLLTAPTLEKVNNPSSNVPALFVRSLSVSTSVPSTLTLLIESSQGAKKTLLFEELSDRHEHLVWAFPPGGDFDVSLVATDQYGFSTTPAELSNVVTEEAPSNVFKVESSRPENIALEPGVTVALATDRASGYTYALAIDNEGALVGLFQDEFLGLTQKEGNALFFQPPQFLYEYSLEKGVVKEISLNDESLAMHHDVKKLPSGNYLSLDREDRLIREYPTDFFDASSTAEALAIDDVVIEFDENGDLIEKWSMMDMLDPTRINFLGLRKIQGSFDWGHANAVAYDEEKDSILVSLRHQDAIVSFNKSSGQLNWILGNHENWPESLVPSLLKPEGDVSWPYAQHDIQPLGEGRYSLFDNGNYRKSPYLEEGENVPPGNTFSRSVIYEVDEKSMTVKQSWEYVPEDSLYSFAVGSTRVLPVTGNVLSNFGILTEDPTQNPRLLRKSAQIIETTGGMLPQVSQKISISNDLSDWGVRVYRAFKYPVSYVEKESE